MSSLPSSPGSSKAQTVRPELIIILLLTVLVACIVYFFPDIVGTIFSKPASRLARTSVPLPSPKATPTPTPKSIPSGKQTFSVSSGKQTGPQFETGAIDPYDPGQGTQQTISVSATSSTPVVTMKLTMETDTKSQNIAMQLTSGTTTKGIWTGTWTVDDTYLYVYNATITATDGQETNSFTITLR